MADERRQALRLALDRLPVADRDLLVRRYFLETSISDLCREHNLSRGAMDNRLWRARQALRAALGQETEVTSHE